MPPVNSTYVNSDLKFNPNSATPSRSFPSRLSKTKRRVKLRVIHKTRNHQTPSFHHINHQQNNVLPLQIFLNTTSNSTLFSLSSLQWRSHFHQQWRILSLFLTSSPPPTLSKSSPSSFQSTPSHLLPSDLALLPEPPRAVLSSNDAVSLAVDLLHLTAKAMLESSAAMTAVFSADLAAEEVGTPTVSVVVEDSIGTIIHLLRIPMIQLSISSMKLCVGLFSPTACISPSKRLFDLLQRRERKFL